MQQDFEIIDDRLRGELPDGLFYQIKLTFNPVSSSHWIKKVFFDIQDDNVLTHQSTYLTNRFCDEAYRQRMLRRKEVDPEGYRIYGLGEWGETGGLIFSNYRIEEFETDMSRFDAMAIGQDFGFNHANAILTLGYKDGDIYVCNELYVHEMDTTEIITKADGKFSKSLAMWCDSAEPDRIKMWRKAGYRARAVVKNPNSIQSQIDWLKGRKIHIHPSCVNVIKEIQQWRWRVDEKLDEYTDEPVNVFDDAMAALRYGVESWRKDKKAKIYSREEYGI